MMKGIITHERMIIKTLLPPSSEAIGPTAPTSPKPDDAGVPIRLNIGMVSEEIIAVIIIGTAIIGCLRKLGIIIFIAPKPIAIGTPDLFTLIVAQTRTAVVAAIPIEAAPADKPSNPMARPIATVEIGLTISSEKAIAMSMHIKSG